MFPKLNYKQLFVILLVVLLLSIGAGILVVFIEKPHTVYIRIIDVEWPLENYYVGDNYTHYDIYMLCEIWNPTKRTLTHHTSNSNLLDPHMDIKLRENYTYIAGYLSWMHPTTHKIKPGIMTLIITMGLEVQECNSTIPPEGNYTVWSGIVKNPELYSNPPFNYTSYNITIHNNYNESYMEFEPTPENWGEIEFYNRDLALIIFWSLTGVELVIIVTIYIAKRKKKKSETLEKAST